MTSFPDSDVKVTISNQGGVQPIWSPSGNEMFYRGPTHYMKTDIALGESILPGVPQAMFEFMGLRLNWFFPVSGYSIDRKGERFLFGRISESGAEEWKAQQEPITRLNLVVNWFEELRTKVPTE